MEFLSSFSLKVTKPLGMQASVLGACPKPGKIGTVAAGRASGIKIGGRVMEVGSHYKQLLLYLNIITL